MTGSSKRWFSTVVLGGMLYLSAGAVAENCITQSQMDASERASLAAAAQSLASKIQANDQAGVKGETIPEVAASFSGMEAAISSTSPKLTSVNPEVDQIYVLDATGNKRNPDGSNPDAEFICTLNKGTSEADFSISALPPGRYGFAIVKFMGSTPWMLSMLLRKEGPGTPWKLAGLFPKEMSAAGHDGLWYWSQGRAAAAKKQPWVAYVDFQEARELLQPAVFVSSTHLENLRVEATSAAPPEAADGISPDAPLIVKGPDGQQYRFTSIVPDDSLHKDKVDIAIHMAVDSAVSDPVVARKRNMDAMNAWLSLHPEMRENFHGVWVFSEAPNQPPFPTEAAMNEIH